MQEIYAVKNIYLGLNKLTEKHIMNKALALTLDEVYHNTQRQIRGKTIIKKKVQVNTQWHTRKDLE